MIARIRRTFARPQGRWIAALFCLALARTAWCTMSIVAVDPATREVGGAGASCLEGLSGGVLIISDLEPGRWALHTQAAWSSANQQRARQQMVAGKSPQAAMDWLAANDAQGNAAVRQYGVAELFEDSARSAAFTGPNCGNYKGHLTGPAFAIQGNILIGARVLDSMRVRFLRTPGPLADRLMAALQGANLAGADSRCLSEGVSSQSAFLRVARPGDTGGRFTLDLRVPSRPRGKEPIDSLQTLYNRWKSAVTLRESAPTPLTELRISRVAEGLRVDIPGDPSDSPVRVALYRLSGAKVSESSHPSSKRSLLLRLSSTWEKDVCLLKVQAGARRWVKMLPAFRDG